MSEELSPMGSHVTLPTTYEGERMTHILTDKEAKAQRGWMAFTGPHGHVPDWDGSPQISGFESSPTLSQVTAACSH